MPWQSIMTGKKSLEIPRRTTNSARRSTQFKTGSSTALSQSGVFLLLHPSHNALDVCDAALDWTNEASNVTERYLLFYLHSSCANGTGLWVDMI